MANDKEGCVALYAARIRFFSQTLVDSHTLGISPGEDGMPWCIGFQQAAAESYRDSLPGPYLERLASVFLGCSNTMDDNGVVPARIVNDWTIVRDYFHNAATAISSELAFEPVPMWEDPHDKDPTTPGIVRFDLLAGLVTTSGASRMRDAGESVADHLNAIAAPDLTETQLRILTGLSNGERVVDLALNVGYSQRTLYREMHRLWSELGVANRHQAVARAAELGLV